MFKDSLNNGTIFTGTVKDVAELESDALKKEYASDMRKAARKKAS